MAEPARMNESAGKSEKLNLFLWSCVVKKKPKQTYVVGSREVTCEFESEKGHINNLNLSKKLKIFHTNKFFPSLTPSENCFLANKHDIKKYFRN